MEMVNLNFTIWRLCAYVGGKYAADVSSSEPRQHTGQGKSFPVIFTVCVYKNNKYSHQTAHRIIIAFTAAQTIILPQDQIELLYF